MKSSRRKNEVIIAVKTSTREGFFSRGKRLAKIADEGNTINPSRCISFEDPEDLVKFLNKMRLALLALLRKKPDSISGLARRLHRSRAAVNEDVRLLESAGIVESEYVANPGHGRHRIIKAIDDLPIRLIVEATI